MRKFLFMVLLVLCSSFVSAALDDPTVYWSFDVDSSDDHGSSDLNLGAGALEPTHLDSTCLIGGCYDFETTASASGQELYLTNAEQGAIPHADGDFGFSGWVNFESINTGGNWWYLIQMGEGCTSKGLHLITKPSSNRAWFETGCADFDTGNDLAAGSWHHYALSYTDANNTMEVFLNGVYQGTLLSNLAYGLTTNDLSIGNSYSDASGSGLDGKLDEFAFWNHTLSGSDNCAGEPDNDICNLYNNGSGYNPISAASILIPGINLSDEEGVFVDDVVSEDSFWLLSVNATLDGVSDGGFECNWSAGKVEKVIFDLNPDNFSIDQDNNYTLQINVSSDSVERDIISFDVCRVSGASRDVSYHINDQSPYSTIDSSLIPLCSSGVHSEINVSTLSATDQINITVVCDGCNPANELRIVPGMGGLFRWFRVVLPHFSELSFNSSADRYGDDFSGETFHRHSFEAGVNEVNVSCNGTVQSRSFTVETVLPNASLVEINGLAFVNGTSFESGNVSIVGECFGTLIVSRNITVSYSNGTIVKNELSDVIDVDYSLLASDDNYTVDLSCTSELGNVSSDSRFFESIDTTNPTVSILKPDGDVTEDRAAEVQVLYNDINLFGYNLSIDCTVQGNVFSEFQVNLSGTSYFVDNVTVNLSVVQDCTVTTEVCDDHTVREFKFDSVSTDRDKRNVTLDGRVVVSDYSSYDVRDVEFIQREDRLSYCYEYDTFGDIDKLKRYQYRVAKGSNWVLRDEFDGHFASWDTKKWIDFVPEFGYDFVIDDVSEDSDFYYVDALSWDNKVCFDSVGGLNCVTEQFNFSVVEVVVAVEEPSFDNITTGQAIFLAVLGFLWVVLLLGGFALNLPFLGLFGAGLGVIFGVVMISFSGVASVVTILINAILIIAIFMDLK